jgi:hypothetical protein
MRQFITVAAILLLFTSLHGQVKAPSRLEAENCTINEFAITHAFPVSFSIGYPKGWRRSDNSSPENSGLAHDAGPVCAFYSNTVPPDEARIIIWRTTETAAKECAEKYAEATRKRYGEHQKVLAPIKTKAGESGYVVVFEKDIGNERLLLSDFFFHAGKRGAIRISIIVRAEDSDLREKLQDLVLQTLCF